MLTLNDIINVGFRKSGFSGYRMDDVDAFIDRVKESYEELLKKTSDTETSLEKLRADGLQNVEKVRDLSQKLEVFRTQEDEIKDALISARKASETSKSEAQHKADAILKEAQEKADVTTKQAAQQEENILKDANEKAQSIVQDAESKAKALASDTSRQIIEQKQELEQLMNAAAEFREKLLNLYKEHLTLINELPRKKNLPTSNSKDSLKGNVAGGAPKALKTAASDDDVQPEDEKTVHSAIQPDMGETIPSAIQPGVSEEGSPGGSPTESVTTDSDESQPEKSASNASADVRPDSNADENDADGRKESEEEIHGTPPAGPDADGDDDIVPEPESAIYNSVPQEPDPAPPQGLDDTDDHQPTISNFDN